MNSALVSGPLPPPQPASVEMASGAVALRLAPGPDPSLREVAGGLSYGRLIAVDLLFGVAIAVGLVLLIVPGIIFFTWFALAGPIVELEGRGVRSALRRSRALVRGRFWTVLGVLVPITLASEAVADAVLPAAHSIVSSACFADWLGEAPANV